MLNFYDGTRSNFIKKPASALALNLTHALDPAASVFVSANAGAGKTTLLVNRVLRLLLHGAAPAKILCLTFTNAAAAEMMSRVQAELGAWVMGSDAEVNETLEKITGVAPDKKMLARARGLFAAVLEAPEGIRIQTIHGFCQSLLKRFPIEAGVSPHFSVMDGRTEQELLQEARLRLFSRAQAHEELQDSLYAMVRHAGETGIHALLAEIIQHKRRFRSLLASPTDVEVAIDKTFRSLQVARGSTLQSLVDTHFTYAEADLAQWRRIVKIFKYGETPEAEKAEVLISWFANKESRESQLARYLAFFLTQKGAPRKHLFKKGNIVDKGLIDTLLAEQERVWRFNDDWKALEAAEHTAHMLHVAEALLSLYDTLKQSRALMDYDDLILTARNLLQREKMTQWVLFKLDGGIDHVLVDEAQDTSPEQWAIIDALTKEFFAGLGRAETDRSLFVVGDEKQSIYSFQGADPLALGRMQRYFSKAIEDAARPVRQVALTHSFRSTSEVLSAVDAVFSQASAREGLMFSDAGLAHIPTRLEHPGLVEMWPLMLPAEEGLSPATRLARAIAGTIRGWIDKGEAEAGGIMILVRSRTALVDRLVRALKRRGVPVAGHDRMRLGDNLAVKDLIALGRCLLLPEDDLTLAAVLKSPIFNVSEEELFRLAHDRGDKSVWEMLSCVARSGSSGSGAVAPVQSLCDSQELLRELRAKVDFIAPHELYSWLLDTQGARRRFIGRMGEETQDPIDEFLNQALLYERSHPPSLQGFMHWLDAGDSEIKRDMEQARGAVRIMTVHGAKGMQAPIVILPDTVEIPQVRDRLLWREDGEEALPFWALSAERHDAFCASLYDGKKQAMLAEYRRLLYVALTRAEDRLYICGATNKEKISEQSWYHLVQGGLAPLAAECEMEWGRGWRLGKPDVRCRMLDVKHSPASDIRHLTSANNFAFLTHPAPAEPAPPKPLSPSRLADEPPAAASPFSETMVYQRGNLIHRLLQYVPDTAEPERERAAYKIAEGCKLTMPEEEIKTCVREALAVIENPQFSFLFSVNSLAEAPVAGCIQVGGRPVAIAGQIDRLYIGEKEIWIVDFKSNRLPPKQDIPVSYLRQLSLYRLLVQDIYPEKTVRCALLWTAVPRIQPIGEVLLDEALSGSYI